MHQTIFEWGKASFGSDGFSVQQADRLLAAARAHPLADKNGSNILSDSRGFLHAKQMVGVIAAPGCSLEILPKVDPDDPDEAKFTVRRRLIGLLALALDIDLRAGSSAAMAHDEDSLLEVFIRSFADQLLTLVRSGLPHAYASRADDLQALRGRLDVMKQFTFNAVRPDRLACRYDTLTHDTPLMQVMKATVVFLMPLSRTASTQRILSELRSRLAPVSDVVPAHLPWARVVLDRTNSRWTNAVSLARLLMKRDWQGTRPDAYGAQGFTLLFPMHTLFEAAVAALLRRALATSTIEVVVQGGLRYCLGEPGDGAQCKGEWFQTKPDILLRRGGKVLAVIDTKWKRLGSDPLVKKGGVAQSDVYQMMAYARIYACERLLLLYPAVPGGASGVMRTFGIHGGTESLSLGCLDMSRHADDLRSQLGDLIRRVVPQ